MSPMYFCILTEGYFLKQICFCCSEQKKLNRHPDAHSMAFEFLISCWSSQKLQISESFCHQGGRRRRSGRRSRRRRGRGRRSSGVAVGEQDYDVDSTIFQPLDCISAPSIPSGWWHLLCSVRFLSFLNLSWFY